MKAQKDIQEIEEVNERQEPDRKIAAFFDLDGTLTAMPSLESRFFRMLQYRREIPSRNYFMWLREALRLFPCGIGAVLQANKMYLRDVHIPDERGEREIPVSSWHKNGHQAEGRASAPPRRNPRLPVPAFLEQAIERVAWHAKQGHVIVIVSGTLDPLARQAAYAMEDELRARGIMTKIRVYATCLEEKDGKWTGRVSGEAMFGAGKARAAKRLAGEMQLDLGWCYGYGDNLKDQWLLAAVGKPTTVNPSKDLLRIARARGWPVLHWNGKENRSPRGRESRAHRQCLIDLARPENTK